MARRLPVKSYAQITNVCELPALIEVQLWSFDWFKNEGLRDLFDEISPIESFNGALKLYFPGRSAEARQFDLDYWFEEPKYGEKDCLERDMTFAAPLYAKVLLVDRETDQHVVNSIFLGDFPLMTQDGTFIINGTERVVVSQLIRSPGVYFSAEEDRTTGRPLAQAKLIPDRGAWMEFESRKSDYLTIKFNRKRTVPVTLLLRALAAVDDHSDRPLLRTGNDDEILALFAEADNNPDHLYIPATLRQEGEALRTRDNRSLAEEALLEFYKRMRPGDPPTLDNAREYLESQLFDQRRYDLERVGRYKLNQRLGVDVPLSHRTVTQRDIVKLIERMIRINNGQAMADDIDHLGNRRVKTVGELIQNKLRVGLRRMERVVKERMSIRDAEAMTPLNLINIRPIVAAVREFFGSSQLSQFMDQTNPLSELTHKRTLSALGPGGLRRERAGFDVRDVHPSHYGRICPIETPEGPNIGLIGRLATYAKVNEFGFIETPYRRVIKALPANSDQLLGRSVRETVVHPDKGDVIVEAGQELTKDVLRKLARLGEDFEVKIKPFVSDDITYLSADEEDKYIIAQANAPLDENGHFVRDRVSVRRGAGFQRVQPTVVDWMDVAPRQIVGISAALIPFLEHDDANRALMGSNMQRQAVPLLQPDTPLVATGMEFQAAVDSGQVVLAVEDGEVVSVTGRTITVQAKGGPRQYRLRKYNRSNQSTCVDQRPVVVKGQRVKRGDVLADSSSTDHGMLALGHDVLVAFMSWEGGNYEDAILISERLVREDKFTSIHIEKHEVEARDTKLGPEEITYDIPNVGEDALKDLDESGIVRIGAEVGPNDILVGKITPKGEKELTPEEKLLRAIFGEKAREVKDSSLRLPHGEHGKVVDVRVFTRDEHRDLPAGVDKTVRVSVAQRRKLTEGDKMAGRHGNKGVISKVVPIADMPFMDDGRPIDIILNPLGVPGRMNIGQILETHLGWAASRLGFRAVTPVFDGANEQEITAELGRAWLIDRAWESVTERAWTWLRESQPEYDPEALESEAEVRQLYLSEWLEDSDYDLEELAIDEPGTRRAMVTEWLRERGYAPDLVLIFEDDGRTKAQRRVFDLRAELVALREWLIALRERLEMAGAEVPRAVKRAESAPLSAEDLEGGWLGDADEETLSAMLTKYRQLAGEVSATTGEPQPTLGKMRLFDGKTGDAFDQPVTVGIIHMMKLAHLVEDKVHARSTGPYSLVTQQPLGGKAQFGGQRFGEMEVWALEAYGAAHSLQEMLTVKSDDVQGRVKTYEAIVKGEPIEEPEIPASFRVLVKELQSLGLSVEALTSSGEVIRFGKDEEKQRTPRISTGLLGLGARRASLEEDY